MRSTLLFVSICVLAVSVSSAQESSLATILQDHTNPPIILKKGNSLVWVVEDPDTKDHHPMTPSFPVFDEDGECITANQYLDEDFFGKATLNSSLGDVEKIRFMKAIGRVDGVKYRLRIWFGKKMMTDNPNKIELCRYGTRKRCCEFTARVMPGQIPYEFEFFDENKLWRGNKKKGDEPLKFETCVNANCVH
jgi:hypothetical protein